MVISTYDISPASYVSRQVSEPQGFLAQNTELLSRSLLTPIGEMIDIVIESKQKLDYCEVLSTSVSFIMTINYFTIQVFVNF